jgi:spore coat polysaccharide biosynthesis predicted glycosyltransferase SpsG
MSASLVVLFAVAAGPRVGFGHLVRCRSLARAMGVTPLVSIRGTGQTRAWAAARGWTLAAPQVAADLIVVDDPDQDAADAWVKRARRMGVPVASVHDLGLALVESDLAIDGSLTMASDRVASGFSRSSSTARLIGPQFAILDPSIAALRSEDRKPVDGRVLVALGGGSHVLGLASRVSCAIAERSPHADIRIVRGFAGGRRAPSLRHATWVEAPNGLGAELAAAQVAVVAGGVTLYEACALGVPVVALPVVTAQHPTVRAAACRGAAIDTGRPPVDDCMVSRTADAVAALLQNHTLRRRQSQAAKALVDGDGAARVAARLKELVNRRAA